MTLIQGHDFCPTCSSIRLWTDAGFVCANDCDKTVSKTQQQNVPKQKRITKGSLHEGWLSWQ